MLKPPTLYVFSRHLLATRKQKAGESLEEFLQVLHVLSKDCNFRNVSAEEYLLNLLRDAFIIGLASSQIRQRLLESNELTISEVFNKARSLNQAEEYSASYTTRSDLITASVSQDKSDNPNLTPSNDLQAIVSIGGKKCYFCGRPYNRRANCSAREVRWFSSEKTGHFSRVCETKTTEFNKNNSDEAVNFLTSPSSLFLTHAVACPGSLAISSLRVYINGTKLTALVDSGSSESYINSNASKKLRLKIIPSNHSLQMASVAIKVKSFGFCVMSIIINNTKYEATRLNILNNLCRAWRAVTSEAGNAIGMPIH